MTDNPLLTPEHNRKVDRRYVLKWSAPRKLVQML
jgi:hypothetical protein